MKKIIPVKIKYTLALIVLISAFGSPLLLAQDADHVYLKTGSVIRGKILEVDPADHVKIEDMCGNIWYYKIAEVEKISSEPYDSKLKINQVSQGFEAGFVNMTSIGVLVGSSHNSQVAPFSLVMVNGYRLSSGFFAGIGAGVEFFSTSYLPLFLDLRYDIIGKDVVPYMVAKGGYGFPLTSDYSDYNNSYEYAGGALFGAGIGLKIRTRNHFAWDIGLLYRYQRTSYTETYDWNNQEYEYEDIFNRIEIRIGFYID